MSRVVKLLFVVFALALGGCAATVDRSAKKSAPVAAATTKVVLFITGTPAVQASADWHTFRAEWRTAFGSAAAAAGLGFSYVEAEPGDAAPGATLVKVSVNDYRYLTSGARYGFGVMTGNAFIDAEAEFLELPARRSLGRHKYATTSSAWQGIFSAMTDKQVLAISNEMIQDLRGR